MTDQHVQDIEMHIAGWLSGVSTWFGQRAKATHVGELIGRGLVDINRLADAAEKIASMELAQIGNLTHIGVATAERAMTERPAEGFDLIAAYITDEERKTLDALREGLAKVFPVAAAPPASIAAVAAALDPPAPISVPDDTRRKIISDYAMWLSTREGVLKVGRTYDTTHIAATIDEYMALAKAPPASAPTSTGVAGGTA